MRGKPDIILVFINLLTHADEDGIVDRHWQTIVDETGLDMDRTKTALAILEAPDPESRTSTQKGRRIMRISPERTWGWQIVNYKFYRSLRTEEERREYMREYMANYRRKQNVNIGKQTLTMLANTDTDTDTDTDKNILSDRYRTEFELAWKEYPDKSGKEKAWKAYKLAKPALINVLNGLKRYVAYVQQRRKTDFADLKIQNGSTWFNQHGWESEWLTEELPGTWHPQK